MKNGINIIKNEQGYLLNSADGARIITRDIESHKLVGILTSTPAVGQAVIRFLTEEEQAEYSRIRRAERNTAKAEKKAEADKAAKAKAKAEAKKARAEKLAAEKAERKAAEVERAELRAIARELKKLEAEEKPAVEDTPVKDPDTREALQEQLRQAKAFLTVAEGTACEDDANEAVNFAYAELAKYDAEHPAEKTEKPVVNPAEPIGKPPYADAVENKKEVHPMKDITNTKRLIAVLHQAKLPADVVEAVSQKFTVTDLRKIVFADLRNELTVIKGVGEKRAETIIRTLEGRIPEALAIKKLTAEVREQLKAEIREKAKGFNCRTYEPDELWRQYLALIEAVKAYQPDFRIPKLQDELQRVEDDDEYDAIKAELEARKAADAEALKKARAALEELKKVLFIDAPLTVRRTEGRVIRLTRSLASDIMGVDYESKKPTDKVFVLNHDTQNTFDFHWKIFADLKEDGDKAKDDFQIEVMNRLGWRGVVAISKDGESKAMFTVIGASAAYQKADKVLMGKTKCLKEHERLFWFGKTMDEFVTSMKPTGAEFLKARANMLRPWMKPFELKNGTLMKFRRLLIVKDVEKLYKLINARIIGKQEDGTLYKDGLAEFKAILGDGAILSIRELKFQGQCSGALIKGFLADASSSIEALCRKHGISFEKFLDSKVEGIDGKMHRLGDFDAICGEGCWKGDKVFESFDVYAEWIDEMAKTYEGFDNLYLLRQAEEIEDEEKVRSLTRTLIQQWMFMSDKEIAMLTSKARKQLKRGKTFSGAVAKLAALFRSKEERTAVNELFERCPWLVMAPAIQNYLGESWTRKQITYASGKFRTEGQYPYIMQDPVALLEVWVLGMDPDDPSLGVIEEGYVSCADVPEGRKLLCVRFPANFLTAQVRRNAAYNGAFGSLNGVMALSVHDAILIIQDGDVDGDEMCVIYNRLAIELTERMLKKFNPPAILFKHGDKPDRKIAGSKQAFVNEMMTALWKAKRYDSVGIYANLAMRCAYLAAICLKQDKTEWVDKYLLWMSMASTGAIIAIDQVKGTAVDADLVKELENITKNVNKAMRKLAKNMGCENTDRLNPFIQYYVAAAKRKPIGMEKCLPVNKDNFLDVMSEFILTDTGSWKDFDSEEVVWNVEAAKKALMSGLPMATIPAAKITNEMIELLGNNWAKLRAKTSEERAADKTAPTLKKIAAGTPVGLQEFVQLLWRNESAMAYSMEGRQLWEKKEEYYDVCRKLLQMLLEAGDWTNKKAANYKPGFEFTMEHRWELLVDNLVQDALELRNESKLEKKGSYAMFILKLVAPELLERAERNNIDFECFSLEVAAMDNIIANIDREFVEDELELFEATPVQTPADDDTEHLNWLMSQCPPDYETDINDIPDDIAG